METSEYIGMFGGDLDPVSGDNFFMMNSRLLSKKIEPQAEEAKKMMEQEAEWLTERNLDLLVMAPFSSCVHAEAKSGHGIIGLRQEIIERLPEPIAKAILYHERTHIQVGSEVRQFAAQQFPEIDDLFHQRMLSDWKEGKLALHADDQFIVEKQWRSLLESDAYCDTLEEFQSGMGAYCSSLQKKMILMRGQNIAHVPCPRFRSFQDEIEKKPDQPLGQRYEENPEEIATQVVTGMEIADIFTFRYRDALSQKHQLNLYDLEEGFANFIGCSLSEVDIELMNKDYRQDDGKIEFAKKTLNVAKAKGITAGDALTRVRSYPELIEFYKELGIV